MKTEFEKTNEILDELIQCLDRAQSDEYGCSQDAKNRIDQRECVARSQECEDLAKFIAEELHYHYRLLRHGSILKIQQAICQILQSKQ